jgi:hypothetical protein
MKRRKRKRSSRVVASGTPKISEEGNKAAGTSTPVAGADRQTEPKDDFIASVAADDAKESSSNPTVIAGRSYVIDLSHEFLASFEEEKPAGDIVTLAEPGDRTHPGDESPVSVEERKIAGPPAVLAGADRRSHPRYEFLAAAEVVAAESGSRVETRVRDLSQQGCYVDTNNALPLGTVTDVRITKDVQIFRAVARVVYSRTGKGMGLMFTAVEPEQLRTLETWLVESRETSWLAANRRRSQRVLMAIPVRVCGKDVHGSPFEEETHTRAVSAHGALVPVSTWVHRGQRLTLANLQTKAAIECVVVHIEKHQSDHPQVGVEFMLPNPIFWNVVFPPKDWTPRHPDAKSHVKTRESS